VRSNVIAKLQRYGIDAAQGSFQFAADMTAAAQLIKARLATAAAHAGSST
jgi:hypothetical protein